MKYTQIYDINRKMHAKPLADVYRTIGDLCNKYERLGFRLADLETGEGFDCNNIVTLLTLGGPFRVGGKIRITVEGDYIVDTLKECADRIGGIFSLVDTSLTTHEILYKSHYGHYPGEEPASE